MYDHPRRDSAGTGTALYQDTAAAAQVAIVERLRSGIAKAGLECGCRDAANRMLDRISAEEELGRRAAGLAEARRMRDAVVLVLALLRDLDELTPDEPDRSAFLGIADLFRDIADFAAYGAEAIGRAADGAGR